jgi:hypothetical protein
MSSRWIVYVPCERIDGETKTGAPIHIVPIPLHSLYSTTDPAEAEFLNAHPKAVLVEYTGPAAPAPSLLAKGKH